MSEDITRSNLPPSPKEKTLLQTLLKQNDEELAVINEIILKAQNSIASSKESIYKLTQSRNTAREMLSSFQEHEETCKKSLEAFNKWFSVTSTEVLANSSESWDPVQTLLASNIPQRKTKMEGEIEELGAMRSKIQTILHDLDEDLRCQVYIRELSTKKLEIYPQVQKDIQIEKQRISCAFSAIKRVPEEIWHNILGRRIAQDSSYWPSPTGNHFFYQLFHFPKFVAFGGHS